MIQGVGYQTVGSNDLRRLPIGAGMNWSRILLGIQFPLRFDRTTQFLIGFRDGNSFDPGHKVFTGRASAGVRAMRLKARSAAPIRPASSPHSPGTTFTSWAGTGKALSAISRCI